MFFTLGIIIGFVLGWFINDKWDWVKKRADEIFRDINIGVNGFYLMNYLAYWSLRIGGFVAWNGHRKRDKK